MKVVKIKLAMYLIHGFGVVRTPVGISRSQSGCWVISSKRFPNCVHLRHFDEFHNDDAVASLWSAIGALHGVDKRQLRALETEERNCKVRKIDNVGITYEIYFQHGVRCHRFKVSTPDADSKQKNVYIGTDLNYLKAWDEALEKARDIRHAWERDRTIRSYWAGLDVHPA